MPSFERVTDATQFKIWTRTLNFRHLFLPTKRLPTSLHALSVYLSTTGLEASSIFSKQAAGFYALQSKS